MVAIFNNIGKRQILVAPKSLTAPPSPNLGNLTQLRLVLFLTEFQVDQELHHKAASTTTGLEAIVPCTSRRMEAESVLHQQTYRALQPQAAQAIQHVQPHLGHHTLASQSGLDLSALDDDHVYHQDLRMQDPNGHAFQTSNPFERNHSHQPMHVANNGNPHTPQQHNNGGQFGILTTGPVQHSSIGRLQQEEDIFGTPDGGDQKSNGHLSTKIVPDPPNLAEWRQKLFNVDEMITLSEEEYDVLHMALCTLAEIYAQLPDILPPCRQCLLPSIDPAIQAQTLRLSLLGLSTQRTATRDP